MPPGRPAELHSRNPRRSPQVLALALSIAALAVVQGVTLGISLRGLEHPRAVVTERVVAGPQVSASVPRPAGQDLDLAGIAARALPSVAAVDTDRGGGSAVVYNAEGLLVTNNHVVEGAGGQVEVTLSDGRTLQAAVLGTDPTSDLALLEVDPGPDGLAAPVFRSGAPEVGEVVLAVGSPFGLSSTVTSGIVSATGRVLAPPGGQPLLGLVQTDAAINPGNSGGALLDASGSVIGINTAILSASGANDGIGFAVPSSQVLFVVEQLIQTGTVTYAQLGVGGTDARERTATGSVPSGALVNNVQPDSAASAAGLLVGDVITAADGQAVVSFEQLAQLVRQHAPGDELTLTVTRRGNDIELTATLTDAD
jgi:putative serine protease PepD